MTTARDLIRRDIFTLVPDRIDRPVIPDRPDAGTVPKPDPLPGIAAAAALRDEATAAIRDCARYAREDGRSWAQIGEAMGCPDPDAAFLHVAERTGRYPSLAWRCPSCGELVTDYGPALSAAADPEQGHAEGCERFAEAVRAWDAQWKDDENG